MSYLKFKAFEQELKGRFEGIAVVRIEPIVSADIYYTDGEASTSACKIVFTGGNTVFIPNFNYNADPEHKSIIEEWMKYVEESSQG